MAPPGGQAFLQRQQPEQPGQPEQGKPAEPDDSPTVIDIPVFDRFDPVVIAPDIEGVPDFLRGKEVKLSDLKKALDVINSRGGSKSSKEIADFCKRFQMEEGHGRLKGMCCPKFIRDEVKCCDYRRLAVAEIPARCCTFQEVLINYRCITPQPVTIDLSKLPVPGTPAPSPAPAPTPAPAPPVRSAINFKKDRPGSGTGEKVLREATTDGGKAFDALVSQLQTDPSLRVQLAGKASSEGGEEYNRDLAGRRAKLVADVLIARGIPRARITEPPSGGSNCELLEDGIRDCGEAGAAEKPSAQDRLVEVLVFGAPAPTAPPVPAGGSTP